MNFVFMPWPHLESEQQKCQLLRRAKVKDPSCLVQRKFVFLQIFSSFDSEIDEIMEHLFLPWPQYGIITFKTFKRSLF